MSGNQNRRRKKIESKRAKKKEKQLSIARFESAGIAAKLASARDWPIVESSMTPDWKQLGNCNVSIGRKGPHGQFAAALFMVDLKCLGVKDVITFFGSEGEWNSQLRQRRDRGMTLAPESPEFLRKLVEGSVEFARKYGIEPHPDYARAAPIFGNLDAISCSTEITYGENGKPHYINGPYETPQRIRRILSILEQHAGKEGYNYSIVGGVLDDTHELAQDDEFEDEEDELDFEFDSLEYNPGSIGSDD